MMKKALLAASAAWICSLPCAAMAQDAPATPEASGIEDQTEIIVTAQRRAERLQDVPIAITALSGEQLEAAGVTDVTKLSNVTPGLYIQATTGFVQPRIRGIGTNAAGASLENSVALYVDGVYMASGSGSLLALNSIERLEVLKGPQGTLFGRNATGGLISVITRTPTQDFTFKASAGYGNYNSFTGNAYIAGGITKNLAADIAVQFSGQGDGYGTNLATGTDVNRTKGDLAVRSKWVFTPSDATDIRLAADYGRRIGNASISSKQIPGIAPAFGPAYNISPWDNNSDLDPMQRLEFGGVSLDINQDLGAVQIQSITAFRKTRYTLGFDTDLTPTPATSVPYSLLKDQQFSQELKLQSPSGSPVQWVAGVYYFNARSQLDPNFVQFDGPARPPFFFPPGVPIPPTFIHLITGYSDLHTRAFAGYAQATVPLGDSTKLTGGFRYSTERRTIDSTASLELANGMVLGPNVSPPQRTTFSAPTWRVSLDHKLGDDTLVYASYNRGFKSGGFNARSAAAPAYQPEKLDAYEVGLKTQLAGRTLRLNVAAFYYDYRNIQITFFENGQQNILNGPSATIYGLDADLELRPTRGLTLTGGVSLLHDRFGTYLNADIYTPNPFPPGGSTHTIGNATGNRLPITADVTFNLGAHYEHETDSGTWSLDLNSYYNSGWFGQVDNVVEQKAYALLDGGIGWKTPDGRYGVRIWGKNLTNHAVASGLAQSDTSAIAQYAPPRTYGVTFSVNY